MAAIALITNPGSGGGHGPGAAALLDLCAREGLDARLHEARDGGIEAALRDAIAGHPRMLVASGGDGTVNAVAAVALEHDLPLGIIPAGTLNHFARDLDIPLDPAEAVRVLAAGTERRVDVALANDEVFLNNASIGLYATIVVQRERVQRRLGAGKWRALLHATWTALRDPEPFEVTVEAGGERVRRRTHFVFVGNNDYELQGPEAGTRARLDDGRLSVYVLHPRTVAGLLWLALRILVRGTSGARALDAFAVAECVVHARAPRLRVARDGEVGELDSPVCFRVRPRALRVVAPAPAEAAS